MQRLREVDEVCDLFQRPLVHLEAQCERNGQEH